MRKHGLLFLIGILLGGLLLGGIAVATDLVVLPTTARVLVDNADVAVEAYNINGSNFFKLRDFTAAIDVGVWWDGESNAIHIETDKRYDPDYTGPAAAVAPVDEAAQVAVAEAVIADGHTIVDKATGVAITLLDLEVVPADGMLNADGSHNLESGEYIVLNNQLVRAADYYKVVATVSVKYTSEGLYHYSDYGWVMTTAEFDPLFPNDSFGLTTMTQLPAGRVSEMEVARYIEKELRPSGIMLIYIPHDYGFEYMYDAQTLTAQELADKYVVTDVEWMLFQVVFE